MRDRGRRVVWAEGAVRDLEDIAAFIDAMNVVRTRDSAVIVR